MKKPMMDVNGYVMDENSWMKCLEDPSFSPILMSITSLSDLIKLKRDNIEGMRPYITNI